MKNLQMFRKLCGAENMSKVCLLTTMWDKVGLEEGSAKEKELRESSMFWGPIVKGGASMRRHDPRDIESAQDVVRSMLDNTPATIKLQDEVVSGKTLIQTDAGAHLNMDIENLKKKYEEELQALKEEMGSEMTQGMSTGSVSFLHSDFLSVEYWGPVTNPSSCA